MRSLLIFILFICCNEKKESVQKEDYTEQHRPQIHFSPKANWMNDPNGMVFHNGTYHLFFQYYPDSTVWGPMHWGHATSTDLVHWKEEDIALYPDSLGYIFSGSAVVDKNNTTGFGVDGQVPIVAIFTYHDTTGEKAGGDYKQTQGLAYSLDEGKTWRKYTKNPVLPNSGIKDFRDPKVSWYEKGNKWIMTLATKDRITFYSSPDLKSWTKESEFGEKVGAHGGVWECPDLFPMTHNGDTVWVLFVSINPGGPNSGSATQYFTGQFGGKTFTPFQTDIRWIDHGPDNYAGVTWSNVGDRKLFLGWMSNWQYGQVVPTYPWRSAMTVPRDLGLKKVGNEYRVTLTPVKELMALEDSTAYAMVRGAMVSTTESNGIITGPVRMRLHRAEISDFEITLYNKKEQRIVIGYRKDSNQYFIDRSNSGKVNFEGTFGSKYVAPRIAANNELDIDLVVDNASVELFADGGLNVMTAIFFPDTIYHDVKIRTVGGTGNDTLKITKLKRIWQ